MKTVKPLVVALAALAASQITGYSQSTNNTPINGPLRSSLPAWHGVASTGCVDESARNLYATSGSKFSFAGNAVSPVSEGSRIRVRQPIVTRLNVLPTFDEVRTGEDQNWNVLVVGYRDPDGKGSATSVRVLLKRVSRTTLAEFTLAKFDSNAFASTSPGQKAVAIVHTFDSLNYNYFVEIELIRAGSNLSSPWCSYVRLEHAVEDIIPL